MKGSLVIAKIAGTLSTAKTMSVNSMKTSVSRSGVPMRRPDSLIRNFPSCRVGVIGRNFLRRRRMTFSAGSGCDSGPKATLRPVNARKTPKKSGTQEICMSTEPRAMKMPRKTMAPRMP